MGYKILWGLTAMGSDNFDCSYKLNHYVVTSNRFVSLFQSCPIISSSSWSVRV